jgi:hypothetical protein
MAPTDDDVDGPRSVTEPTDETADAQMNLLGLVVAVGSALVMLPLVPVLAVAELVERVVRVVGESESRATERTTHPR